MDRVYLLLVVLWNSGGLFVGYFLDLNSYQTRFTSLACQ